MRSIKNTHHSKFCKGSLRIVHKRSLRNLHTTTSVRALQTNMRWPSRFTVVPKEFWDDINNQRSFAEWLGEKLGIGQKLELWYKVPAHTIIRNGGSGWLSKHDDSVFKALTAVFPTHDWKPWKFTSERDIIVWSEENQLRFFEWIAKQYQLNSLEDFYKLTPADVTKHGGGGLLALYGGSLIKALEAIYPQHEWLSWRFSRVPRRFWSDPQNQRKFFDWLYKELGLQGMEGWYDVRVDVVAQYGGTRLLSLYKASLAAALSATYPNHTWELWRFHQAPRNTWSGWRGNDTNLLTQSQANDKSSLALRDYFANVGQQLGITSLDQWYSVSVRNLSQLGSVPAAITYAGLPNALASAYPEHQWDYHRFEKSSKKVVQQTLLRSATSVLS